jgi:hypothetical protein
VTAHYNIAVGNTALMANTTGSANTAVGFAASLANTTGGDNTCVGYGAGGSMTTANESVMIGRDAGATLTTGARCTVVGESADVYAQGGYEQVFGWNVHSSGSDRTTLGADSSDSALVNGATTWSAPSDVRYKEDIQDEKVGLDFINDLRPVTFLWKKENDLPKDHRAYVEGSEKRTMNGKYNHGFIAQEVKEVIDKYSDIKDGFDMWSADGLDGRQRVGEGALIPMLVNAVQELSAEIEELKRKLKYGRI